MKKSGFTLVEVLVVLAIIGVIAGIAYPVTRSFVGKSQAAACLNNLRSLSVGLEGYLQDHNNKMPGLLQGRASKTEDVPVIETVLLPYVGSPEAFQCPADKKLYEKSASSYFWNFFIKEGTDVSQIEFLGSKDQPEKVPLIYDKEEWHPGGTNILYADHTSSNKLRFVTSP